VQPTPTPDTVRLQGDVQPSATIINLIQVETLPLLPEEKIKEAIQNLGGHGVSIRRVLKGNVRDDQSDTLVLEGTVPNQVALVRVLEIASQLFAGRTVTQEDIRVVADEAGALADRAVDTQTQGQSQFTGFGNTLNIPGLGSGGRSAGQLSNQVRRNLARAKVVEAADGRILSFITVADLPQIRVDIRLLEVNRTKLRSFDPNSALLLSNFRQPSLAPAGAATAVQGSEAARVGVPSGAAVQEVLSFLGGALVNQFQFAARHLAISAAVSLLEREGIARTLSSPSLTVLSGEMAQFQVGGDVPIPIAFAPAFGGSNVVATPGVFSAVDFVSFGVQLRIRPLAGEDDSITLDVEPRVVTPDLALTDTVRQSTGTDLLTTAFQTRALRTSSRLQDGDTLLVGGLSSNNATRARKATPGLSDTPVLGWLFKSFSQNDDSQELVIVVNPVIVRSRLRDAALWSFPDTAELMRSMSGTAPPASSAPRGQQ
jgi:Flp pilus assembly secretin CpaC